jgi:alpha-tubulin suppressor-like RCC1 family protein
MAIRRNLSTRLYRWCVACTQGENRCAGNTRQTCGPNGQWIDNEVCIDKTCIAGTCQGQCASGDKRCSANYPQVCNASGAWENDGATCGACFECDATTFACKSTAEPNDTCTQPTTITTGRFHTCALLPDKTMKCWGYNAAGQLGLSDKINRGTNIGQMGADLAKLDLGANLEVENIGAGTSHTCARFKGGSIKCWGNNAFGQLGLGDSDNRGDAMDEMGATLPTVAFGGLSLSMSLGETHTCAILDNGSVKCWGGNFYGQLGLGNTIARGDQMGEMATNLPSLDFDTGVTATRISAGDMHTCAQLSPVVLKCWGNNSFGQLGLGDTNHRGDEPNEMGANLEAVDVGVPPGIIIKDIRAGGTHSCVLLSDGTVKCWGKNDFGQLGQGDSNTRGDEPNEMGTNLVPIDLGLSLGITVIGISAGAAHTCALLSNGTVKCWGKNDFGQLGLGDKNARGDELGEMGQSLSIVNLGAGVIATEVHAGHSHTCALLSSGRVKCWGRSVYGQLGQSDTITRGDEPGDMGDKLNTVDL